MSKNSLIQQGAKSARNGSFLLPRFNPNIYIFLLLVITLALYGNTVLNEYALDDGLVINDNKFTQNGVSGIPDILTKDTFHGALGPTVEVAGGRYRPLSVVTFALEHEIFGQNPHISHLINVLLFACTVIILFLLLKHHIFRDRFELAFLTALLFTIHPIHTEVVANIKSRDEILSFLFLLLALALLFRSEASTKKAFLVGLSVLLYCLALLSKENGVAFIVIIPLFLYFFSSMKTRNILWSVLPFLVVAILYLIIRFTITGAKEGAITEVLNAPYLYATVAQKYATIIFVLGKYLSLLFFPHPLTYDYSYNQIPYVDFTNLLVWCSLIIHGGLLVYALAGWRRKSIFSFAILYYFITISLVANIVVDIGAPMGERLLYQPSLALCLSFAAGVDLLSWRVSPSFYQAARNLGRGALILIVVLTGFKTITRNADWKNNETLFIGDLETSPNSASAHRRAALALIRLSEQDTISTTKDSLLHQAIGHLQKAITIHPTYGDGYLGLGVAYSRLNEVEKADEAWSRARKLNINNYLPADYENYLKIAYFNLGIKRGGEGRLDEAARFLLRSIQYGPNNPDAWYFLGGAYSGIGQREKGKEAWEKVLTLKPDYPQAAAQLKELTRK